MVFEEEGIILLAICTSWSGQLHFMISVVFSADELQGPSVFFSEEVYKLLLTL